MTEKEVGDFKCPGCGVSLNVLISKEAYRDKPTANIDVTVEDVCEGLSQDVLPNLNVAVNRRDPTTIHIVPKKFLGKENWFKVSKAVKAMRGEWVSQGKHSYWWVPTTQETKVWRLNKTLREGRVKDLSFSQIGHVSVTTKLINNLRVVYTTLVCMHRGVNYGGRRREIVDGVNGTRIERSMRV